MNSGRLKIDIEYLSNGSALRQNNRVVLQQYYYHYKLTWKTAAGAFNIRFTDGNIVRKVPFYSTIDVKNLKDYAFFEYFRDSGAGSLMKMENRRFFVRTQIKLTTISCSLTHLI